MRAIEHNQSQHSADETDASYGDCSCIPSFSELSDGWASNFSKQTNQPVTQKDIENYSIKSSNITCLQKMACYRQSIHFDRKNIYKISCINEKRNFHQVTNNSPLSQHYMSSRLMKYGIQFSN